MTETSSESTQRSNDTINVLPTLSKAEAPVSLTLTIDKSVSKLAGWVFALMIGLAMLSAVCTTISVMTVMHSSEREVNAEAQSRKTQNHVDEMTNELKRLRDRLEDRESATRR